MTSKNCANDPKLVLKDLCEKSFVQNVWLPNPDMYLAFSARTQVIRT